jgi:hypothetical protein
MDMESWRLTNECADAAAKFWKLAGYHDGESNTEYTNHFNKKAGEMLHSDKEHG